MQPSTTIKLHSGNEIPVIGLGTWKLTEDTAGTIAEALELGYKMIDTSGDYGTQPGIGEGLKKNGAERESVYIVTKVEETDDAYEATRQNLEELDTDYADLMLVHRPPENGAGVELWRGLIRAKKEGLTQDIGVSNYSADLIDELINETGETPVINQVEWSPFGYSEDLLDYARGIDMIIQAYSPVTRTTRLDDDRLGDIAAHYDKTPAQILLRWNVQHGTVPIPKAGQEEHLKENIHIFDFEINGEDMDKLNNLNEHYSSLGTLPYN